MSADTFDEAARCAAATYEWITALLSAEAVARAGKGKTGRKTAKRLVEAIEQGSFLEDAAYVILDRHYRSEEFRRAAAAGEALPAITPEDTLRNITAALGWWVFRILNSLDQEARQQFAPFILHLASADPNVSHPRSNLDQLQFGDANRVLGYNETLKANNTLFELVVGLALSRLATITEMDDPDRPSESSIPEYRFHVGGEYWAAECKTVQQQLISLLDLVTKAWKQVGVPDACGRTATAGLVVVNVSRLLPGVIPRQGDRAALTGWLEDELRKLRKEFEGFERVRDGSFLRECEPPALPGLLVYAQVPAVDSQARLVTVSRVEWWPAARTAVQPSMAGLDQIARGLGELGSI